MGDSERLPSPVLDDYGWTAAVAERLAGPRADGVPARVVRTDWGAVVVATPQGVCQADVAPGFAPGPVTGDWVVVDGDPLRVLSVVSRSTTLARRDASGSQVLAANVDEVLVMCALDRPLVEGQLDRALVLASDSGAVPVAVLSKADLCEDAEARQAEVAGLLGGIDVVATSSVDGRGVDELRARMARGRTVALLGESGVGKSSLANALAGRQVQPVGEVRERDRRGRHTTRARHLVPVGGGAVLLDTPGLRTFGIVGQHEGLARCFSDVEEFARQCRFGDCSHEAEPGCAVAAAASGGHLAAGRLERYRRLAATVREPDQRPSRPRRSRRR